MKLVEFLEQFELSTMCEIIEKGQSLYAGTIGGLEASMIYGRTIGLTPVEITAEGVLIVSAHKASIVKESEGSNEN